jgi:hypothetical protein
LPERTLRDDINDLLNDANGYDYTGGSWMSKAVIVLEKVRDRV